MGLSNEERLHGLYYSISGLIAEARKLPTDSYWLGPDNGKQLLALIDQLWPCFLTRQSNGGHWIFGSSATDTLGHESESAWATPIVNGIATDAYEQDNSPSVFNSLASTLSIPSLLNAARSGLGGVYEIFAYTESMVYLLRRYTDGLAETLSSLSDLICQIQGECFSIFSRNGEVCTKAYLLHQIFERLYTPLYPYAAFEDYDVVTRWLTKHYIQNYLSGTIRTDITIKMLKKFYSLLIKSGQGYDKRLRLSIALDLVDTNYSFKRQHQELLGWLKEDGWEQRATTEVEVQLSKLCAAKDAKDAERQSYRDLDAQEELYFLDAIDDKYTEDAED